MIAPMQHIFDISRTVRTFGAHFGQQHCATLEQLLRSVNRCLEQVMPPEVSGRVDREGSTLVRGDGALSVQRHPDLEAARVALARLGVFRVFLPEDVGGFGLPLGLYYLVVQQVSYFDTSLAVTMLVHGNAMYAIERHGTTAQRERYLPALARGEQLASVAFTEATAGSDAGAIRTTARRQDDGQWLLSGDKLFITHGGDAELLITTARTGSDQDGIDGVSTFILEPAADGVELVGLEHKTALAGSPTAALSYPDLRIPADRLLGDEGRGGAVMFAGVGMTRVNIGAQALGIAKRAHDAAATFALQRQQGGRLIVEHDAIQQRLAGMALVIAATEGLICHDSWLEQQGEWHVREMSVTKYFASEALQQLTLRAVNVHGGYGACREYEVERCRREALALPLYGGTSEIQWYIISRELLDSLDQAGHVDYRARDMAWIKRAAADTGELLAPLVERLRGGCTRMWKAVERVGRRNDPTPFYRHLAELVCAFSVAQVLLHQATAEGADDLDRELARWAVDRLERQADHSCVSIQNGVTRHALKTAVMARLRS